MPTYETTALPPSFAHIDVLREMDFRAGKYPVELLNALLPYNLGWRQAEARKPMIDFFGKLIHPGDLYFRSETLTSGRSEYRRLTVDSIERVLSLVFMLIFEQEFQPAAVAFQDAMKAVMQHERGQLDEAALRVEADNRHARWALLAFALSALLAGVGLSIWLARSITQPLRQAVDVAEAIARFDLSSRIEVRTHDETGRLLHSLASMQGALQNLVRSVRLSTDSISVASAEIATGNMDLSSRTEQTASSLQEAAASMMQLTGTVRQTADSAATANQLASSAAEVAQRGGSVVSQVVSTMEEISGSSRRIGDIIGTIDGIAFQTNILALNAAVEAARAGEQGRGFAVVAGEVRSLAQRSAEAAREIKTLIGASVEKVESGARLVKDAGETMTEIVSSVQRVTDIIGEISAAAQEQRDGIDQINVAVSHLDQMTQQNAALVEEAASAAESLKDQSSKLAEEVTVFRV